MEGLVANLLAAPAAQEVKYSHYRQYDTYFLFSDEAQGRVRYREDDTLDDEGKVSSVRTRLTFTAPMKEREFEDSVLLSRSRFIAPAARPLRFYREYFRPSSERTVQKERRRWHVLYKGVLFYINVDRMIEPQVEGAFLEIKCQTWSLRDAEFKATLISEMLEALGLSDAHRTRQEYIELAAV
jgi:5-methylthioadenosine/S-adenosylhomocysteine deaminase